MERQGAKARDRAKTRVSRATVHAAIAGMFWWRGLEWNICQEITVSFFVESPSPTIHRQIAPNVPPTKKITPSSPQAAKTHPTCASSRAPTMLPKRHQVVPTQNQCECKLEAYQMRFECNLNTHVMRVHCKLNAVFLCPETHTCKPAHLPTSTRSIVLVSTPARCPRKLSNPKNVQPSSSNPTTQSANKQASKQASTPASTPASQPASQPACGFMRGQLRFFFSEHLGA